MLLSKKSNNNVKFETEYNHIQQSQDYSPITPYKCIYELEEEAVFPKQAQFFVSQSSVSLNLAHQNKNENGSQTTNALKGF